MLQNVAFHEFDANYIEGLRNHDPAVAQHFFGYFRTLLSRRLRNRGVPADLAEDIQQETYLRVLRSVSTPGAIQHPERFGAFVCAVCSNVRQECLRRRRHVSLGSDDHHCEGKAPNPEAMAMTAEMMQHAADVLQSLSEVDRKLICMVLLQDKSNDEVCRELNVNPTCFRVRLHRARTRLRQGIARSRKQHARC